MATPMDEPEPSDPAVTGRMTLMPPSVGRAGPVERPSAAPPPLTRAKLPPAEEAVLRSRIARAHAAGDEAEEVAASVALARWLVAHDRGFERAAELGLRALRVKEDPELRRELATWLEGLGDAGLAAATLRPTAGGSASDLVRAGVLYARAADATGAAEAFEDAAKIDPDAPLPLEMRATLAAWAPDVVSAASASDAYVEAAARRSRRGEEPLEDLLRAFEACPKSSAAADALATALDPKSAAADEIQRAHASALALTSAEEGAAAHARRRVAALVAGDVARALGAALDEGLDTRLGGGGDAAFHEVLVRAGLLEPLAARLEAAADLAPDVEKGRLYETLARLSVGPLAQPSRAAVAYAELIALKGERAADEPRAALRALATDRPGDATALFAAMDANDGAGLRRAVRELFRGTFGPGIDDDAEARLERAREARLGGRVEEAHGETRSLAPKSLRLASIAWVNAALAGDLVTAARAIERVADETAPAVKTVLLAVAAERLLAAGDAPSARAAAERACQNDSSSARAISALAAASSGLTDRTTASALERAIRVVAPRGATCGALATALEALGETGYAVAWSQQHVTLRPGDASVVKALLERVVRAKDASRLSESLVWLATQPQPASAIASMFAEALRDLAVLDADRAVVVARRALDTFGPRNAVLREAILAVAEREASGALARVALERWIDAGAPADERRSLFLELAKRCEAARDPDGEARALYRALTEGRPEEAPSDAVLARVEHLTQEVTSGDARLAIEEANALLAAHREPRRAASAFRALGAALWDAAEDPEGAIRAWIKAAELTGAGGYRTMTLDLARFSSADLALSRLAALAEAEPTASRAGSIAADAAQAALSLGESWRAFELADLALSRSPEHASALETAEQGATGAGRPSAMSPLYEAMGGRALGRYGRRAAHYRGARFFEQHGEAKLALKHAAEAFLAVPSEGATFLLLSRVAQRAGDFGAAVRAIETVAELSKGPSGRAAWLLRAARAAGPGEEGARRRVDILLRAALLDASVGTLALLRDAVRELLACAPEEIDAVALRIANASRMLTARAEGPDGARAAIAMSRLALDPFEDGDGAISALDRAMAADADLDEYLVLVQYAGALGAARGAGEFLHRARAEIEKPYSNVGVPLLKLLRAVGATRGDDALVDRFAVHAAIRDPEDVELVREADAAVKRLADPALTAKLDKKISPEERAELLGAAPPTTEVAAPESPLPERTHEELAASDDVLPLERASHWAEVAAVREAAGEVRGAAEALREAALLDAEPLARWTALERAAELAGAADLKVLALREVEVRSPESERPAVLRRLAQAYMEAADPSAAAETWRKVLGLIPDDEEADRVLENVIRESNDYEQLAKHLAWRAARLAQFTEHKDALRAVRFRRAAILEQRLGRTEEAASELRSLLEDWPDNINALRYLADLYERTGQLDKVAPLWRRLSELTRGAETKVDLELRAVMALKEAGEPKKALALLKELVAKDPASVPLQQLRAELARDARDDLELGQALAFLSEQARVPADRSALLVEAAQAAARVGDATMALAWARRAAEAEPTQASTQLFARGMEYRARGAGSPTEARATVTELDRIVGTLDREDEGLRTFLVAEALTAAGEEEASVKCLTTAYGALGAHPLVAMGLGERMIRRGDFAAALPLLEAALAGSLLGFRSRGVVALAAADAAVRCERAEEALRMLEEATFDEETRTAALKRTAQLTASLGDVTRSRAVLLELTRGADARDRPVILAQLGRLFFASGDDREHAEGERAFQEAISLSPEGSVERAQLVGELEVLVRRTRPPAPPAPESLEEGVELVEEPEVLHQEIRVSEAPRSPRSKNIAELETAIREAGTVEERIRARRALARSHVERGASGAAEAVLWDALAEGSIEAGDDLAELLHGLEGRSGDLLRVRRAEVELAPGVLSRLDDLRQAALADHNPAYARAVEHVARAFDAGAGPLPTPPLTAQIEQPGLLPLLLGSQSPAAEALGILWESSSSLFARDPSSYSLTGLEHVEPGGASPLTRLYEVAARLLDLPRIPLYVRRTNGALVASVALLHPAAAVLTGDVREETPDLRHALGHALASALPRHALLLGQPEHEGRATLRALLGAFGPPEYGRELDLASGRLAESLWRVVPGTAQRRLQDLLRGPQHEEYAALVEQARQACRRVALFLNGDFAYAVGAYLGEVLVETAPMQGEGMLAALCANHPAVADLLRLATRPAYADARWRSAAPPGSSTHPASTGRFRFSRP